PVVGCAWVGRVSPAPLTHPAPASPSRSEGVSGTPEPSRTGSGSPTSVGVREVVSRPRPPARPLELRDLPTVTPRVPGEHDERKLVAGVDPQTLTPDALEPLVQRHDRMAEGAGPLSQQAEEGARRLRVDAHEAERGCSAD